MLVLLCLILILAVMKMIVIDLNVILIVSRWQDWQSGATHLHTQNCNAIFMLLWALFCTVLIAVDIQFRFTFLWLLSSFGLTFTIFQSVSLLQYHVNYTVTLKFSGSASFFFFSSKAFHLISINSIKDRNYHSPMSSYFFQSHETAYRLMDFIIVANTVIDPLYSYGFYVLCICSIVSSQCFRACFRIYVTVVWWHFAWSSIIHILSDSVRFSCHIFRRRSIWL